MKKLFKILFFSLICFTFFSCESTKVEQDSKSPKNTKNISDIKTPVEQEKLRFIDWKYKGFGNELPLWVEAAINQDKEKLKKIVLELENSSELEIIIGNGENLDQAEQTAKSIIKSKGDLESTYRLYESFWVRENFTEDESCIECESKKMPYTSVYVYYKY